MRRHLLLAALLPLVVLGCPSETPAVCDNGACDQSPDGSPDGPTGGDAGPDGVVAPEGCDANADPKDAPKCVVNDFGIFVDAATGNDGNSGSKELPMKSIGGALAKLNGRPRIYVCEGTYPESVKLASPISIFGGFACATWIPNDTRPKISPATGVPLSVTNVAAPIVLQQLELTAAAQASTFGDSAIAAFIASSTEVTLRRMVHVAGDAADGEPGKTTSNWSGNPTPGKSAADGSGSVKCTCTNVNSSTGGKGGAIGAGGDPGESDPAVGALNGGGGGNTCLAGGPGANGAARSAGTASTKSGSVTATAWSSTSDAMAGLGGNPGQGGGGGGGRTAVTSGGGGGCGGCGGGGGTPGGNGGSSFALLVSASGVKIDGGAFSSGSGGTGGKGGDAQPGQSGASGGVGACDGGTGGHGAGGGGGGGGAGGHSAAVAYVGIAPQLGGAALTPAAVGAGGPGGAAGTGAGNAGSAGGQGPDGKSAGLLPL